MLQEAGQVGSLVASDGSIVKYRAFEAPARLRRASVLHLHGIQSHGGWYVETAAELARRGYSVYLLDRRGSGLNPGSRGFFRSRFELLDDVRRLVELARRNAPGLPVLLIGGCWGAKLAVAYALDAQQELAGLALVCPALHVKVDLSLRQKLTVAFGQVVGPRWRVPIPLTPEMFTSNPPYLDFIRRDPLALRDATARLFFETFLLDRLVTRRPHQLRLPLLLMQASPDPIVDEAGVRRWFDRVGSPNKRSVVYPGFGHILDFEERRQQYWEDLAGWLDEVTGGRPAEARGGAPGRAATAS